MSRRSAQLWVAAVLVLTPLMAHGLARPVTRGFKLSYAFTAYGYTRAMRFSNATGLFYDAKRDELYVADTGNSQIVVLDNKGVALARFRHEVWEDATASRKPGEPRSVAVRANGDVLVTDNMCNYLDVLDFQGRSVQKVWPADLLGLARSKVRPGCLAIDRSGNILLSVTGDANAILVLTPDYRLKTQIGRITGPAAQLEAVTGLWTDEGGRVYATYAQGDCVRIYSLDGRQLTSFGSHDSGPGNFSLPSGVVTDQQGNIWVADMLRHVVSVFMGEAKDSGFRATFARFGLGGFGSEAGDLAYPSAIAGDGSSRIFVLEKTGARVQAFKVDFGGESTAQR